MHPQADRFRTLREHVPNDPGELDPVLRRAAFDGGEPPTVGPWLRRVRHGAASIEDEHVAALREAGLSEDQIFELTVCAAMGAADLRLRAALATLSEEAP